MLVPLEHIPVAAWTALKCGADDPSHPFHLLTLATADLQGAPSARLMINRGAEADTGILWFHTDSPMSKVAELRSNPLCCVVGWDPSSGVQLRLFGRVDLHQQGAVADRHWEQVVHAAGWLYSLPGGRRPVSSEPPDLRLPRDPAQLPHKLTARARDRFVVIQMQVELIDWVQAVAGQRRHARLHPGNHWRAVAAPDFVEDPSP